jgi:protein gp37
MSTTSIEWVRNPDLTPGQTLNSVTGCEPVSSGCDNCYPIPIARIRASNPNAKVAAAYEGLTVRRNGKTEWSGRVNVLPERAVEPLGRRKPTTYFVPSMGDLFHKNAPDSFIALQFAVFALCPQHTFIITTKRHGRMKSLLNSEAFRHEVALKMVDLTIRADDEDSRRPVRPWPLPNVRLGVSVENQATALLRIPALLDTPAAVRWISAEPLLGPIELWDPEPCDHHRQSCIDIGCWRALDWVVTGGESGRDARPAHPDWFRSLRDQCLIAEVPFFFKQHGEYRAVSVVDNAAYAGGRMFQHPTGGLTAAAIREPGPSGTMRDATLRPLRAGDVTKGGVMLDDNTFAAKVGKGKAGHDLDGVMWQQFPGFGTW